MSAGSDSAERAEYLRRTRRIDASTDDGLAAIAAVLEDIAAKRKKEAA